MKRTVVPSAAVVFDGAVRTVADINTGGIDRVGFGGAKDAKAPHGHIVSADDIDGMVIKISGLDGGGFIARFRFERQWGADVDVFNVNAVAVTGSG